MADTRLVWREGVYSGLVAGTVFGAIELVASALTGPLVPIRMAASVFMGHDVLTGGSGAELLVGLVVHLALSMLFGLAYGALTLRLSPKARWGWGLQSGIGLLFGAGLWLVNFQVIARMLFPWFLQVPQFQQLLLHAFCFGLPLALTYAAAERRVEAPVAAPQRFRA